MKGWTQKVSNEDHIWSWPLDGDILIHYSTVEGYNAFRNPEQGTFFIRFLFRDYKHFFCPLRRTHCIDAVFCGI